MQRLGALVRQRPRARPGTSPAIVEAPLPCDCGTLLIPLIEPFIVPLLGKNPRKTIIYTSTYRQKLQDGLISHNGTR